MARDVIVIGGGIAGASVAYFLAGRGAHVVLLEREEQPGYHATGRSAASLLSYDQVPVLRDLKIQSAPFFASPPDGFCQHPVFTPSGILLLFDADEQAAAEATAMDLTGRDVQVSVLAPADAVALVPALGPDAGAVALWFPRDGSLDVHALLWGYLRRTEVRTGVEVLSLLVESGRCVGVTTSAGELRAGCVVCAAGAWAGAIARTAGLTRVPVEPRRRSAILYPPPGDLDVSAWPLTGHEGREVYFRPESGGLMMSPMDATPEEPCDARPDEMAVAEGVERLRTIAPGLVPRTVKRRWAGLRTFAPDGLPVVGEDPALPGFFWLACQGGSGIETSPVLGAAAADLITTGTTDRIDARTFAPDRFPREDA